MRYPLFDKVRAATTVDISTWAPENLPLLPIFPLHTARMSLSVYANLNQGGDVLAEESDTGYFPVTPRTSFDAMWEGEEPQSVVSLERNRLQLCVI